MMLPPKARRPTISKILKRDREQVYSRLIPTDGVPVHICKPGYADHAKFEHAGFRQSMLGKQRRYVGVGGE